MTSWNDAAFEAFQRRSSNAPPKRVWAVVRAGIDPSPGPNFMSAPMMFSVQHSYPPYAAPVKAERVHLGVFAMKTKLLGAVCVVFAIAVSLLAFSDIARSDVLFSDDFNSGASAAWGNDLGIGQQMAASTARKIRATNQILTRSSRRSHR